MKRQSAPGVSVTCIKQTPMFTEQNNQAERCHPESGTVIKMKKSGRIMLLFCLCMVFLAGCGEAKVPDVVDKPTVAIGREGEITVWQIGDFDKSYYNVAELANMAAEEVKEYNAAKGSETVVVEKAENLEDGSGRVVVAYRFDGWESCTDFCEDGIFFGTVKEAALNGFDTAAAGNLKSVKDGTPYSGGSLQEEDRKLIVTDMKANIYCPGKVIYISEGVAMNQDGSISCAETDGLVYILLQ